MKKTWKQLTAMVLAFVMTLTLVPAMPAQASNTQSVKSRTISAAKVKKIANSSSANVVLATESTGKYTAIVKGSRAQNYWEVDDMKKLYITSGTSEKVFTLKTLVKNKYNLGSNYKVEFYQLTAIKGKFYIVGSYGKEEDFWDGNSKNFIMYTTSGSSMNFKKINKPLYDLFSCSNRSGWGLYYFKDKYLAIPNCMTGSMVGAENKYRFYKSSDLSTWTNVDLKPSTYTKNQAGSKGGFINIHLTYVTPKAVYFNEEVNSGPRDGYGYVVTVHNMYTTNLSDYKASSVLNDAVKTNGNRVNYEKGTYGDYMRVNGLSAFGNGAYAMMMDRQHYGSKGYWASSLNLFVSNGANAFKKAVYLGTTWDNTYNVSALGNKFHQLYVKTPSNKFFYRVNGETGSSVKYTTSLNAAKFGGGDYKNGAFYMVYGGQYILVTKNNGKTVYKINTGRSKLTNASIAGDYLVLAGSGGYDYYVSLSAVNALCK